MQDREQGCAGASGSRTGPLGSCEVLPAPLLPLRSFSSWLKVRGCWGLSRGQVGLFSEGWVFVGVEAVEAPSCGPPPGKYDLEYNGDMENVEMLEKGGRLRK